MDLPTVMLCAATLVAAEITTREARDSQPMTPEELAKALARARDAVWASLKIPNGQ